MSIPDQMTAIAVETGRDDPGALHPVRAATPKPAPGEVLIRVRAAGLNRADILQRKGQYPPPPGAPDTIGMEAAGEVAAIGEGAARWSVGDRVCALLGGGGYAEYVAVDGRHCLPVPESVSLTEAGALPEAVLTVFVNVFEAGGLRTGETFMVHGATSGIGVTALQMAKAQGAKTIATARGAAKADQARAFGPDLVVDASTEDFVAAAKGFGGTDVILDMVGGDYTPRGLQTLKRLGRLVLIATQGGTTAELNLLLIMLNRLTVTGSTLRGRAADEKARLVRAAEAQVWPWIGDGRVRAVVDRTFPLAEAAAAHAWLESGDHVGKVVLTA